MNKLESGKQNSAWKGRLLKFIIYVIVGFLCAFLYRQLKK
jgi:hypothetical protein